MSSLCSVLEQRLAPSEGWRHCHPRSGALGTSPTSCLSVHPSIHPFVRPSIHPSVRSAAAYGAPATLPGTGHTAVTPAPAHSHSFWWGRQSPSLKSPPVGTGAELRSSAPACLQPPFLSFHSFTPSPPCPTGLGTCVTLLLPLPLPNVEGGGSLPHGVCSGS